MNSFTEIRIREWHFIVLILSLTVLIYVLGTRSLKQSSILDMDDYLIELNDETFLDSIYSRLCFVLFYIEDSDSCNEMNYNLNRLAENKTSDAGFFKLNLKKHPVCSKMYNISGVPNILIFSNGKEIKRIMGVVPEHNLEKIYNRITKKNVI